MALALEDNIEMEYGKYCISALLMTYSQQLRTVITYNS